MSNVYTEFGKVKDTILQDISNVKSKSQVNDVKIKIRLLTEFVLKEISAIPAHDLKYYTSVSRAVVALLTS